MSFFVHAGDFFGNHLLLLFLWLLLTNLLSFVLLGEDENRVAHRKARYPFALLLILSLIGGSLGALIGYITYNPIGTHRGRGLFYSSFFLLQLLFWILCILYAPSSPIVYLVGVKQSFSAFLDCLHKVVGGHQKIFAYWFLALSLITFVVYGLDKRAAISGGQKAKGKSGKSKGKGKTRVPECWLLLLAVGGGALGALAGMLIFRHKIRHPKFFITVPFFLFIQFLLFLTSGS